ncbi:MAG TPA: hypothetical protein DEA75_17905 [Rhodobacteraceae bacterium]|jgi:hypothetical protein|nr:class I SAM-dependent methyltransferase [Paracoccaceae bacterium]HBS40242.1 hypothetical protein [Paracoccaceae bacterium]
MTSGNYFRDYLLLTEDKLMTKMDHYLDVYHRLLAPWRSQDISFLEIGVWKGGSIKMWQDYFGAASRLTFLDIDPACKTFEVPGIAVEIGDQSDHVFLQNIAVTHGPFDIIIDDGGHKMYQQKASFNALWPQLSDGGLYIVEDTHSSYWPGFGGGYRAQKSFIEFSKDLVDRMHSWYTDQDELFPFHPIAEELSSVQFYDSMVVFEKKLKLEPPKTIVARNGVVTESRKILEVRKRKSVF